MSQEITEVEERRRGELLVEVLNLKKKGTLSTGDVFYDTQWGTKTALGLFRVVQRIVTEGK